MSGDIKKRKNSQVDAKDIAKAREHKRTQDLFLRTRQQHDILDKQKKSKEAKGQKDADKEKAGLGSLLKTALSAVTTNIIITTITDTLVAANAVKAGAVKPASYPDKIPSVEGRVIKGPAAGGQFLDRPIAGALADKSMSGSLQIDYAQTGKISSVDGKGVMIADGQGINVSEHVPGSTAAKVILGKVVNPGEALGSLTETAVKEQEERATNVPSTAERMVQAVALGSQAAHVAAVAVGGKQIGNSRREWKKEIERAQKNLEDEKAPVKNSENHKSQAVADRPSLEADEKNKKLQKLREMEAFHKSQEAANGKELDLK